MMDKNSRGKLLLSLALNKSLQAKIGNIKENSNKIKVDEDRDFVPDSSGTPSDEEDASLQEDHQNEHYMNLSSNSENKGAGHTLPDSNIEINELSNEELQYTKKGTERLRKKFTLSLKERKAAKLQATRAKHNIRTVCELSCLKKCANKFDLDFRNEINKQFWSMTNKQERNIFILNSCAVNETKKKTVENSRRSKTYIYSLKDRDGKKQVVCKSFFLTTLGFHKINDKIVRNVLSKNNRMDINPKPDGRKNNRSKKIDRKLITEHINSFSPQISHYRKEHAPLRKYLPNDIIIQFMYDDFKSKYPNINFSYYLYHEVVSKMNISFSKLGHEECFDCEKYKLHCSNIGQQKENVDLNCEECCLWYGHHLRYTSAREEYQRDAENQTDQKITYTADMQKVIMLPRCDTFKEIIFTPRLIAFNETFVPAGKKPKPATVAVVWNESVSGRSAEDVISTFYAFFLSIRDIEHIILWLDNCSAQNKNWSLFSFFVYLINSTESNLKCLEIKYFEPGHTFTACDSFHHLVEGSLKKKGKVYDFGDFVDCIKKAKNNVTVIEMQVNMFYKWMNCTSQYKLNKIVPRPYLHDMVVVIFERGVKTLTYKKAYNGHGVEVNFLNAVCQKNGIVKPPAQEYCRGISKIRKETLLNKLADIIPPNRQIFWKILPTNDSNQERDLE